MYFVTMLGPPSCKRTSPPSHNSGFRPKMSQNPTRRYSSFPGPFLLSGEKPWEWTSRNLPFANNVANRKNDWKSEVLPRRNLITPENDVSFDRSTRQLIAKETVRTHTPGASHWLLLARCLLYLASHLSGRRGKCGFLDFPLATRVWLQEHH